MSIHGEARKWRIPHTSNRPSHSQAHGFHHHQPSPTRHKCKGRELKRWREWWCGQLAHQSAELCYVYMFVPYKVNTHTHTHTHSSSTRQVSSIYHQKIIRKVMLAVYNRWTSLTHWTGLQMKAHDDPLPLSRMRMRMTEVSDLTWYYMTFGKGWKGWHALAPHTRTQPATYRMERLSSSIVSTASHSPAGGDSTKGS